MHRLDDVRCYVVDIAQLRTTRRRRSQLRVGKRISRSSPHLWVLAQTCLIRALKPIKDPSGPYVFILRCWQRLVEC